MNIIFCSDPLNKNRPEPLYANEVQAARDQGFDYWLLDSDALFNDKNFRQATRKIAAQEAACPAIYRGWMLSPPDYAQLYEALARKNVYLINDPAAYKFCHYLPEFYEAIKDFTPRSVWLPMDNPDVSFDTVMTLLEPFGQRPIMVKDYVKSRKHEWLEACFIPAASNRREVERVVDRFLELQGENLEGGLVFREFVEFEPVGTHPKSGLPLTNEHRLFFLDGQPVFQVNYWDEGDYPAGASELPIDQLADMVKAVKSRFFTLDVARTVSGEWQIIELGDGQVSGLPDKANLAGFYRALAASASLGNKMVKLDGEF